MRASRRYAILLAGQLLLILHFPLTGALGLAEETFGLIAVGVCFAGLHLVTESRRLRIAGGLLFAPAVVAGLLALAGRTGPYVVTSASFGILFVGFVTAVILWELLTTPRVTGETLYGAVVGYLFIGIVFGMLYMLVEQFVPGSLRFSASPDRHLAWGDTTFFSFVTLTTIGYGDLIPAGGLRALVLVQGIIGAMYPPVLIGRLLASYQPRHGAGGLDTVAAEVRATGSREGIVPARTTVGDSGSTAGRVANAGANGADRELHESRKIAESPRKRGG
jgi:hypothetical protein